MKKFLVVLSLGLTLYWSYSIIPMEAANHWQQKQVVVYGGDTLWNIAERWTEDGEDVRAVLYRIREANDLPGNSSLQPGQKLIVPVRTNGDYLAQK